MKKDNKRSQELERARSLLRQADEALTRQGQQSRSLKERDADFVEAQRAHREAVAVIEQLRDRSEVDEALVAALAPLQVEIADLEILMSEIRFDEAELSYRYPRLRSVGA
ncbi:MAG: hypothetical protein JWN44_3523 [Myxococcales bacterium]|nr:hypothetical protein [Myxococcales bacterium]